MNKQQMRDFVKRACAQDWEVQERIFFEAESTGWKEEHEQKLAQASYEELTKWVKIALESPFVYGKVSQ